MPPSQPAHLAAVFIAIVIVVGSAGYGIGRGIQESDGNAACGSYLEDLQNQSKSAQEEGYNIIQHETTQYEADAVVQRQAAASCTCQEIAEALQSSTTLDCWPDE